MKRLVTGIQATGSLHIGNYFGAMRPALARQDEFESYLFVADVHALNQIQDAEMLRGNILEIASAYLAVGIDPAKTALFQQSAVPEQVELSSYLAPFTSLGLLERAHAFKDAVANGKQVSAGLFFYPVLMAADILAYQAEVVPVGKDQLQHLEIAREIAERVNHIYGEIFIVPQAITSEVPILPGLDGRKMSKSYNNTIGLFDSPDEIMKKVARIVTDSKAPGEPKETEGDTVFQLYSLVAGEGEVTAMRGEYARGIGNKEVKDKLAAALIAFLEPMRNRKAELDAQPDTVRDILQAGATRAKKSAQETLEKTRRVLGLS